MFGSLDAFDRLDDEWRGDFIDLTTAKRSDDTSLHAAALILIADDSTTFQVFPESPSIAQSVATRWLLAEFLSLSPGDLPGLHEAHLWPVAKSKVCDTAAGTDA